MRLRAISAPNGWTRVPAQRKPRHRGGYRREETEQVEATCQLSRAEESTRSRATSVH
jgi:hypothetical protein